MKEKGHQTFSEEKIEEEHDEHIRLKKNSSQLPSNLDFKYQKLLFWVPVIAGLAFVAFGIIRQSLKQQQKFYCYQSAYIPTGFRYPFPEGSPRELQVNTRYGFKMWVDSYDHGASKKIAEVGTFEPAQINLIGHIVKTGDQAVVVGGHVGLEAIVVGKVIDEQGKLYTFVPTTFLHSLLTKNLQQQNLQTRTTTHKTFPSDTTKSSTIQVLSGLTVNKSSPSPSPSPQPVFLYEKETIQYDTIDNALPLEAKLNFAYINVDKFGVRAVGGMKRVIERSPDLVIMVRWQSARFQAGGDQGDKGVLNFLAKRGYKAYTYKGGSYKQNCIVGQFLWQGELEKLNVKDQMLLFFPEGFTIPR